VSTDERADPAATGSSTAGGGDTAPIPELWATPDEYSEGAARWAGKLLRTWATALHPVLGLLGTETVSDLPAPADLEGQDAGLSSPLYRSITVELEATVSYSEVLEFDAPTLLNHLYDLAEGWGSQMTAAVLGHISDVSDSYGQTVDASGRDFGDAFIEAIERIDLSFDADGNPQFPVLVVGEGFTTEPLTPEQESKLIEVVERKREEHRAAQRRPELP